MRKRVNNIDCSALLSGIGCGDHQSAISDFEDLIEDLEGYFDVFSFRLHTVEYPESVFYEIAKIAKEKRKFFAFLYAYQFAPNGKRSHLDRRIVENIKKIAGQYFLGEIFAETGSEKASKPKGYFNEKPIRIGEEMPPQNFCNMREAKDNYVSCVKEMIDYDNSIEINNTMLVEATAFSRYNLESGVEIPVLEVLPANPESLIPFVRGAAVGYQKKKWGGFIAHEWYGGYNHQDKLKEKRLKLSYNYLYLSGANLIFLESGYNMIDSFGYRFNYDSPECTYYRKELKDFYRFQKNHPRPTCGPVTKIAFLHGNLDGYTGFMGSSVWSQFDKKEWGMSYPEYSWKILDEVYRGSGWYDFANFGKDGYDYSVGLAYGQYDVLPVESDLSVLNNYDVLIFVGWNTMTDNIYDKLKNYVTNGGHLVISAAHLNTNDKRDGQYQPVRKGFVSDLLGCSVTGVSNTNCGVKFSVKGLSDKVEYPGTLDYVCDCNYGSGYADYVTVELNGGKTVCFFDDKFVHSPDDAEKISPAVIENKIGDGLVTFLTHVDFPGHPAVYPLYKTVVKEILTSSNKNCELQVICNDKIRYALYYDESGGEELFLLNTDYNILQSVTVFYKGQIKNLSIPPCDLAIVTFNS